jgi:nicotinamide riboside transporter PnuC
VIPADALQPALDWVLTRTAADWAELFFVLMSVVGQHFISQRKSSGFAFWLAGNLVAIALFATLGRIPTTALYMYFTYKCITGWLHWRKLEQSAQCPGVAPAMSKA